MLQLMNCNNPDITEAAYMEVIYRKTAKLFEAGMRIGTLLGDKPELEDAFVAFGRHLGQAFQLVDDALDYEASPEELGKNIGDDLAEGKPTLPLIYAMDQGTAAERHMIREAIETGGTQNLKSIQIAIESSGGLRYTADRAREEAQAALKALRKLRHRAIAMASSRSRNSPSTGAFSLVRGFLRLFFLRQFKLRELLRRRLRLML